MKLSQRRYHGPADQVPMADLARQFAADNMHVVDLPYRFSSWAFDTPENVGLWVNGQGELMAWAVLQTPFWALDYAYHPAAATADIHQHLLTWADQRARQCLDTPSGRPMWFINVFAGQNQRLADLEAMGFVDVGQWGEDSWSKVLLRRPGPAPVDQYQLPAGFVIRPLAGPGEVEAYVELHQRVFNSKSMTAPWRHRTLEHPAYTGELDLVAVAPNGQLAAFCIGWLDRAGQTVAGQIEPLGVDEAFRGQHLGRSLLLETLTRLQSHGAENLYVETDNQRDAALSLYQDQAVGFQVIQDVRVYRKDY